MDGNCPNEDVEEVANVENLQNKLPKPSHFLSKVNEDTTVSSITILLPEMISMVSFKKCLICVKPFIICFSDPQLSLLE